jgi:hypothetical protein
MLMLPYDLSTRCRNLFLTCSQFESYEQLQALFTDSKLNPFRAGLKRGSSPEELVDLNMAYLLHQEISGGKAAFPFFLVVLRDKYQEGNHRRDQLTQLIGEVDRLTSSNVDSPPIRCDPTQPHFFDLIEMINTLRDVFGTQSKGAVGLAVDCDDANFFENFCQRLMPLLNNPSIPDYDVPLAIRAYTHGISNALKTIDTLCLKRAELGDVIVPVQLGATPSSYLTFWEQLCMQETIQKLDHRLVVIVNLKDAECRQIDPALISLGQPVCKETDAFQWLDMFGQDYFRDITIRELWKEVICCECRFDADSSGIKGVRLDVAQMYKHIRDMRKLLDEKPTQEVVKNRLLERKMLYG